MNTATYIFRVIAAMIISGLAGVFLFIAAASPCGTGERVQLAAIALVAIFIASCAVMPPARS